MRNNLTFSIITSVKNSEASVLKTINSVSKQDFRNYEHVILDGGSSDSTCDIIRENLNENIKFFQISDSGIYPGFNNALRICKGNYIIFLNSDDFFFNNRVLSDLNNIIKAGSPDIIYGNLLIVGNDGSTSRNWVAGDFKYRNLKLGWAPPHPAFIFRRDRFKHTFREDLKISSDYDFMLKCLAVKNSKIAYFSGVVTVMVEGGVSSRNIASRVRCLWEDYRVVKALRLGGVVTVLMKRVRKINQFLV